MTIEIVVTEALQGPEAQIQRTSFETIHRLKNLGLPIGENLVVVGDPFSSAYVLRFLDDTIGTPNVLYVSRFVKDEFYKDKTSLEIRPI